MAFLDPSQRVRCPCCGYPTLGARGGYEICELCSWEDDGQDDATADDVRGGPNHGYSLSHARQNFRRFLVMYEPERDRRVGGPDRPEVREIKRRLIAEFERWESATDPGLSGIVQEIRQWERQLALAQKERIREHEAAVRHSREAGSFATG